MKSIIRNLSGPTEFCLILFVCFGLTIVGNTVWLIEHLWLAVAQTPALEPRHIQNEDFIFIAVFEVVALSIALGIGHIRGWTVASFGLRPSWKWSVVGVLVFLAFLLIQRVLGLLAREVFHGTVNFHRVCDATIPFVILISIVNPVFEELFECGYFFQALQRHGMWITVLASAAFRGFLHTTMGINGFVFMFAEGLLHGFFYWKWRQLWPLILAHSLQMLYVLLPPALAAW